MDKTAETVVGLVKHVLSLDEPVTAIRFEHVQKWFIVDGTGHDINAGDMLVLQYKGTPCPCGSCDNFVWEVLEDEDR